MTQRTLTEARRLLEDALPHLSDYWKTRYTSVMEQKEQRARQEADETVARRTDEALGVRDSALRALTEVRDGLDDLARDGKTGRISSQQYLAQMEQLKSRQQAAEEQLDRADAIATDVERIEANPLAWFSELQERTPRLKSDVPW
jgi:hypothetical protein